MAAKICADIKPSGWRQIDIVDLLYMIVTSFRGIAAKLDADTVTDTTYLTNLDACMNLIIEDSKGNRVQVLNDESSTMPPIVIIKPTGFDKARFADLLYMLFNAWETICEQIDADTAPPTSVDYESEDYTALYTYIVENSKGNSLGNGTVFYFRLGAFPQKEVVDCLYAIVRGVHLFTAQADTDAVPGGTDYESLWYTNNITLTIENSAGSRIGN
jgi:hypothetical protein